MNKAFDNQLYLKIQREEILKRIKSFDGKLYLEFGGKLFDDYHASRVLPGFEHDSKVKMLLGMKEDVEIVIVVNADDIKANKVRNDFGITYEAETTRLIEAFNDAGLYVSSVVLSFYEANNLELDVFEKKLRNIGINVYKHYKIFGYPQNVNYIVSEEGLGKNEYIKTTRPLVVVTAPGPGSGKMATCISQLYHDNKNGIKAGYAKYETFPTWNLPLNHPINLAYESATADLNDVNMIDPYHLEAYKVVATNYNRDIETFPILRMIFEKIYGESIYKSPTDMGVNMIGFAITDEELVRKACEDEVIRRYYCAKKNVYLGKYNDNAVEKIEILMNKLNINPSMRKCVKPCLDKANKSGEEAMSIELHNGKIVTGRRSELLGAPAALLLNSLKTLAKIDDSIPLLSRNVIEPIQKIKTGDLKYKNPRIRAEEILIALGIQASSNPLAELALKQLPKLCNCDCHSSVVLSEADNKTLSRLGLRITEEPKILTKHLYR